MMNPGWFITGTDTGIGKTLVTTTLIQILSEHGQRAVGMKPVASGCRKTSRGLRNDDAELLIASSAVKVKYEDVNPYAFAPPVSPHLAARATGTRIELQIILDHFEKLREKADCVLVEGVGGWCVPLGRVITTEHMAKALGLPVILVVGLRLGCLNHALLTVQAIRDAGLELAGWVANHIDPEMECVEENIDTLRNCINAPIFGTIPFLEDISCHSAATYLKFLGTSD